MLGCFGGDGRDVVISFGVISVFPEASLAWLFSCFTPSCGVAVSCSGIVLLSDECSCEVLLGFGRSGWRGVVGTELPGDVGIMFMRRD